MCTFSLIHIEIKVPIYYRAMNLMKMLKCRLSAKVTFLRERTFVHTELLLIVIHSFLISLLALMRFLIELQVVLLVGRHRPQVRLRMHVGLRERDY